MVKFNAAWLAMITLVLVAGPRASVADDDASRGFDVYELAIFVCDPNRDLVNERTMFGSTMPSRTANHRPAAEAMQSGRAYPVSVIQLHGESDAEVDVVIDLIKKAKILGHWPKARARNRRLLWEGLRVTSDRDGEGRPTVPEGHWFHGLRQGDAEYLQYRSVTERFLVYDVELPNVVRLAVESSEDGIYTVVSRQAAPLHDVCIYEPDTDATWRTAEAQPIAAANEETNEIRLKAAIGPGIGSPQLSATETKEVRLQIDLTKAKAQGSAEVLAFWAGRLRELGLSQSHVDYALAVLRNHGLDEKYLTVVYRLDASVLEKLTQLDVTPQPRRTVRVALVIVVRADPKFDTEIDALIGQLGDPQWTRRQAAQQRLTDLGSAIRPRLKKALEHKDLEVVYRVERLIARLSSVGGE